MFSLPFNEKKINSKKQPTNYSKFILFFSVKHMHEHLRIISIRNIRKCVTQLHEFPHKKQIFFVFPKIKGKISNQKTNTC